jgi:alkylation response protein AidB-like acyl-CoA dehydrogenase
LARGAQFRAYHDAVGVFFGPLKSLFGKTAIVTVVKSPLDERRRAERKTMPIYKAPLEDVNFLLNEVFQIDRYDNLPGFSDASADVREAVLGEAAKLSEEVLQPLNRAGDLEGCARDANGDVKTPKGFKEAFRQMAEGGWLGLSAPTDYGGQGLPVTLSQAVNEFQCSANMAFAMYGGLTMGATAALIVHGSPEQKAMFVPKMVAGEWTGTMNLTEPQCGTDLGLLRTKAVKQTDGSYKISGTKIFISAGEHDLTENIIHLVLARIEGAPAGIKGISLFVVPKFLVKADGSLGARNGVSCGSIEHKMGIHGNSTCVMNYDNATGWLIGEENKGMQGMFVMMNEARLGVAVQGLAQSEVAYQNAAAYARDRLQGRSLSGAKAPDKPADPIIVHPDVRRTLLTIRAFNEAARAMVVWTALKSDVAHRSSDPKDREAADDHMGLMTPVLKGFLTDVGFANTVLAQQIYGGHGYIAEQGMEQFVRDARIAMIYEGANGIQALDLVGRKLPRGGGRAVMAFFAEVAGFAKEHGADEAMKSFVTPLSTALGHLQQATTWLMQNAMMKPDNAGAAATDYLHLFGLVTLGYMWAKMAKVAHSKIAAGGPTPYLTTKLVTGRFFMERMLPETAVHLARLQSGSATMMELAADAF